MALLSGEYQVTLDEKNRLTIPIRFREGIPDNILVLTRGMIERCIWAYNFQNWEQFSSKIKNIESMPTKKIDMIHHRVLFSTYEEKIDKIGRITIPQKLKDFAGLTKDVDIVSNGVRIEIWDSQRYAEYEQRTDEEYSNILDELGPIVLY